MIAIPTSDPAQPRMARWTRHLQRSVLRQMIAVVSRPGILSFAGGLPDPALFPTQAYADAVATVLAADSRALQYGPPHAPLQQAIVGLMAQRGVTTHADNVFITTGAQQVLDILTRLFVNPGDLVILEENIYTGILQALAPFQPQIAIVGTDLRSGIDVDGIERLLRNGARPAFIYVVPDAHNPLGVSMSLEKRQRLVALAQRYAFPLIEDDPYGLLAYDGPALPPLHAIDPASVFYVGSFSKILAPALRLGWTVVPDWLLPKLTVVKEAGDLESSALTQRAVATLLASGMLPDHLATLRATYGRRRDALLDALQAHFSAETRWTQPNAGMFIWVELPRHVDTAALLHEAIDEERVAFIPGYAFSVEAGHARHCLRLNFTNTTVDRIEDGIRRLGRVVARHSQPPSPA